MATGGNVVHAVAPERTNRKLYADTNPSEAMGFSEKIALLQKVDAYARGLDPRVKQVSVSMSADWQAVEILRGDGSSYRDVRPLVRFNVAVVSSDGKEQGQGHHGLGGRGEPLVLLHRRRLDGRHPGGAAPEPRVARGAPRTGGRDGRAARPRLARHPAA